jgi:hypothetical protein
MGQRQSRGSSVVTILRFLVIRPSTGHELRARLGRKAVVYRVGTTLQMVCELAAAIFVRVRPNGAVSLPFSP